MNIRRRLAAYSTLCLSTVLLAAPAARADAGLVAAYGFEEPAGATALDSSGNANAGALSGPARSASGRFGRALSFDGFNDRVTVADSASLDLMAGMTLEAWVRPAGSGWRTALLKERPGGLAYALYASTNGNRPSTEGAGAEVRGPAALPSRTWSHLASTYDGATLRLFVNGSQVASRPAPGSLRTSSGALRIGGNAVWGEYFKGRIDEVRVYDRPLSADEIAADMALPVVDTIPPTVSLPNLCAGTTIHDYADLRVRYADDHGPVTVRVEVDGQTIWGPYERTSGTSYFGWETRDFANGPHTMTAIARDAAGNETVSEPCEWNVDNPEITLAVTAPGDGDTVSGTVTVSAEPRADGLPLGGAPVGFVAFTAAGQSLGADSSAPYEATWDTTAVPDGDYEIRADVYWIGYATPHATSTIHVTVDN